MIRAVSAVTGVLLATAPCVSAAPVEASGHTNLTRGMRFIDLQDLQDTLLDTVGGLALNGLSWALSDVEHEIPGTGVTLTMDNYYREMAEFGMAGFKADDGAAMQEWYLKGTGATEVGPGLIRAGPGPSTVTRMGFVDVKETCEAMADKIEAGSLERRNELGTQVLGSTAWPEAPGGIKTIILGQSRENHAFIRPILAAALDKGLNRAANCDGSSCWNDRWLRSRADAFLQSRGNAGFETSDLKWFVSQLLHKILLNIELSEAEAREFAEFMNSMVVLIPLPDELAGNWAAQKALNPKATLSAKRDYLARYEAAVRAKYPVSQFPWAADPDKVTTIASAILDTLLFAGGLSVPTVMQFVLALTHMAEADKHSSLRGVELELANYEWILWETLRKYAPVGSMAFWEHRDVGGMDHVIVSLGQALMDGSVFPAPTEFKNRGLDFYRATMAHTSGNNAGMGWGGPAVAPNKDTAHPHSHNCPGQDLSFHILTAFFEAFIEAGPWSAVDKDGISISPNQASNFKLLKRGLRYTTGCSLFPSCREGYEHERTKWCSWGLRDWSCKVF